MTGELLICHGAAAYVVEEREVIIDLAWPTSAMLGRRFRCERGKHDIHHSSNLEQEAEVYDGDSEDAGAAFNALLADAAPKEYVRLGSGS